MRALAFVLISAVSLPAQGPVPSIGGVVLDAAGAPVAGAEVVVRWRAHPELPGVQGWSLDGGGGEEALLRSDARGRFRFEARSSAPCAVFARRGDDASAETFPLLPGDFTRLTLAPAYHFRGRVVDEQERPVATCRVILLPADASMTVRLGAYGMPPLWRETQCDDEGRFDLRFEHGYLQAPVWFALPGLCAESADGNCSGRPVRMRPQSDAAQSLLKLGDPAQRVVVEVRSATDGHAIAGATVLDCGLPRRRVTTDAEGRAVSPYLGGQLWISAPGFAPLEAVPGAQIGRENRTTVALTPVSPLRIAKLDPRFAGHRVLLAVASRQTEFGLPLVSETEVGADGSVHFDGAPQRGVWHAWIHIDGVFVPLARGDARTGEGGIEVLAPVRRRIRGEILDPGGVPARHARVCCIADGWPMTSTWTDAGGRFDLAGVPPLRVSLLAVLDGRGTAAATLDADRSDHDLRIALHCGKVLEGRAETPEGAPLRNAWVSVSCSGADAEELPPTPLSGARAQVVFTGEDGRFRFESLAGRSVALEVAAMQDGVRLRHTAQIVLDGPEANQPLRIRTAIASRD